MAFLGSMAGGSSIGDALIRIGADTRQMRAEMAAMNAQVKGEMAATGQTIERQTAGWGKAFTAVKLGIAGLAIGLGLFTIGAIKSAREFDRAMGQVYALTGITKQALDALKTQVLELAKVVPQSPKALAEGLYYIISSGFEAADALKILEVSAKDAAVGMTDTQTVADGLTSALNAYGASGAKAAEFSDIMTQTIVQGKAEWADLARSIGAVSVQGATAGITFKEVSASIANLTLVGLTAQRGSRNLAFLIRALEAPNNIAAKTFGTLGLKVDENTLKEKGLIGMLQMMSKAAGKHHDVIVKNAKGQIDWAKSQDATAAANKGWADRMRTMTGGAAGFLVAQILLQENGKRYTDILKSMDEAGGLTASSFERMKESDPGMMFDLLKNKITVAAIEWGNKLMPLLSTFLGWLVDAVPAAFQKLGDVWQKYLAGPVGRIFAAVGKLAGALGALFSDGTQGGDGLGTALDGVASAVGALVDYLAKAIGLMAELFGNPVVQAITRVLLLVKGVQIAIGLITGVGGGLSRRFMGMASSLTGGFIQRPGAGPMTGLDGSAVKLDGSAVALKEAAVALKGGATALKGGAVASGAGGALAAEGQMLRMGRLAAMREDVALGRSKAGALLGRGGLLRGVGADVAAGAKSAFSTARGAISGALGLVSKAFFPLMIADLGLEFIKAPLGDFLAKATPWKRAAASMKEDFFGGLVNMVKAWNIGSDLFVALPQIQLGKTAVKTENLGNFNLDAATIERLTSGGLAGTLEQQRIAPDVMAALQQRTDESVRDWGKRIADTLEAAGLNADQIRTATASLTAGAGRGSAFGAAQIKPEAVAAAREAIQTYVDNLATDTKRSIDQLLSDQVSTALSSMGFDPTQIGTIPPEVRQKLAQLFKNGVGGQYSALMTYTAQEALRAAGAIKPNVTAAEILKRAQATPMDAIERGGKRNLPTPADAANQAFSESLAKNVGPAQERYREWWAEVMKDPGKQVLRDSGQAFIDRWAKDIRGAKTDKAKAALAKKMKDAGQGMSYEAAQQLLKDSEDATGRGLLGEMTKQFRATILAAAKDGSASAAPDAAKIFFAANAAAIGKAKTDAAKQKLLDAYNAMFPKGSEAKIGNIKGFSDAFVAWQGAGFMDPSKPDAMVAALGPLPGIADGTTAAMNALRDASESARIKLNSVAEILNIIGGVQGPDPGDSRNRPGTSVPTSSGSGAAAHAGAINKAPRYATGGYKAFGQSAWAGEYGPELLPASMSGNVTSTSKVRAMMGQLAQQAASMARGGGDQHLYVDHMHIESPADKLSILEAVNFLAPAGR